MNQLIAICAGVVGIMAFIMMADISGGGGDKIDFKTATLEQRQAWMDDKAKGLKSAARFFLPSGGGPMNLSMSLSEVVTSPQSSQMEMIIDVKVPYGREVGVVPKDQILEKFCKNYIRLGFYRNKINLVVSFRNKKTGDPITRLSVQPYDCQYHAEQS